MQKKLMPIKNKYKCCFVSKCPNQIINDNPNHDK